MTNIKTPFSGNLNQQINCGVNHQMDHRINQHIYCHLNRGATINKIIQCIIAQVDVSRIYQMGYRRCAVQKEGMCGESWQIDEHFDVLVITDGRCTQQAFDLQDMLNKDLEAPTTVSVWVHSGAEIEESLTDLENGYFFHRVVRSGNLLYQKPNDPEFENVLEEEPSNEIIKRCAYASRYARAKALMTASVNITEDETEAIELWLLHQAMQQVCLAFIFVMIGYKPNQYSLNHLFSICRCLSPLIDEVFPTQNKPDQEIFKVLTNSELRLRLDSYGTFSPADTGMLYRRCRAWMEKAEEIIKSALSKVS